MNGLMKLTCALTFVAALGFSALTANAMKTGDVVRAGFTGLPLRNCEGIYCGELKKLPMDQPLKVLIYGSGGGWSYVEVAGTNQRGWICNENVY